MITCGTSVLFGNSWYSMINAPISEEDPPVAVDVTFTMGNPLKKI